MVRRKGKREVMDFAARMMAVSQLALGSMGLDHGTMVMSLAVQAKASGIDNDDFKEVCDLALKYGIEFERATLEKIKRRNDGTAATHTV